MAEAKATGQKKFPAYGPDKEAWKAAGNYYSAKELERMSREFADLKIEPAPDPVYDAN